MNYESQEEFEHFEGAMEQSVPPMNNQDILERLLKNVGHIYNVNEKNIDEKVTDFITSLLSSARVDLIREIMESLPEEGWVGSLDETVRDNLIWYKENGTDHGDLVIAEEAILTKVNERLATIKKSLADMK